MSQYLAMVDAITADPAGFPRAIDPSEVTTG